MAENPQPQLPFLEQPHEQIPEIELSDFIRIMKSHFGIGCEPTDKPYLVRFVGEPFNEAAEKCRALSVTAHNRGTRLCPHNIWRILEKFKIPEKVYLEAYELSTKRVTPIRPDSSDTTIK